MIKKLVLLICFLCFGCGTTQDKTQKGVQPPILLSSDTVITKHYDEAGGLYNREYEITIRGTGEVFFKGNFAFKEPVFQDQWRVPPENIASLVEAFYNTGFFELGDRYGEIAIDGSQTSISIIIDGKEKKVRRLSWGKDTPEKRTLKELEILINQTVDAEPRIRKCCYFPDYYPSGSIP